NEKNSSHRYFIFDKYDTAEHNSSMARTTGFTCCAVARFLLEQDFEKRGICPPEFLGENENCYNYILSYLSKKGIGIDHSEK
ncbi:MAG: saccharopine dehydrogenase, partial [Ignavibacteria bacterium]|nr:saccharopine dehydrogenase [Ignavibacteria bacterium]